MALLVILVGNSANSWLSFVKVAHALAFFLREYKEIPNFSNWSGALAPLGKFLYPLAKLYAANW